MCDLHLPQLGSQRRYHHVHSGPLAEEYSLLLVHVSLSSSRRWAGAIHCRRGLSSSIQSTEFQISDAVKKSDSPEDTFKSLVVSFYCLVGLLAVSAVMYTVTAITMPKDQRKVLEEIQRECDPDSKLSPDPWGVD